MCVHMLLKYPAFHCLYYIMYKSNVNLVICNCSCFLNLDTYYSLSLFYLLARCTKHEGLSHICHTEGRDRTMRVFHVMGTVVDMSSQVEVLYFPNRHNKVRLSK